MGQKVNPIGYRLGVIRNWDAKWYTDPQEVKLHVEEDFRIRDFLAKTFKDAQLSHIEIERLKDKENKDRIRIMLHTAKPGHVIGVNGENKNKAVKALEKITKKNVFITIIEVRRPERNAQIIADNMARELENRASFRRVQKIAIQRALRAGAKGIRTLVSGRLGGAEMARSEGYSEGKVPLQTLRADIDYATSEALTTYGILGVKVWVYNGEVLPGETREGNLARDDEKFGRGKRGVKRNTRREPREQKQATSNEPKERKAPRSKRVRRSEINKEKVETTKEVKGGKEE